MIELQTNRLILRQWKDKDYPKFAQINADAEVMRYYPKTLNVDESNAMAEKLQTLIATRGWGFWAVEKKIDGVFIGFVGLHEPQYDLPVTPCVEIGWRLAKDAWGNGYATEAGTAALDFAFNTLDLSEIFSFTSVTNNKSIAVMQRLGLHDTKRNFEHPIIPLGHPLQEHVLYKIKKLRWLELVAKP